MMGNYWLGFCSLLTPHVSITNEGKPPANDLPSPSFAHRHSFTVSSGLPCVSRCWMLCKHKVSLRIRQTGISSLSTTELLGWIMPHGRAWPAPVHCTRFSTSLPLLMPLALPLLSTQHVSRHYQRFPSGGKLILVESVAINLGSNLGLL